jgi:signal peptidase I
VALMKSVGGGILAFVASLGGCLDLCHEIRFVRVAGADMVPAYRGGERVTVDLDAYRSRPPRRGDVILFHPPEGSKPFVNRCGDPAQPADGHPCDRPSGGPLYPKAIVRRISAVGGDWIAIRRNRVFVSRSGNGPFRLVDPPRVRGAGRKCLSSLCNLRKPVQVPAGTVFVTNDNRDVGADSRRWGPVALEWVDGKVTGRAP